MSNIEKKIERICGKYFVLQSNNPTMSYMYQCVHDIMQIIGGSDKGWKMNKATLMSDRQAKLLELGWEPIGIEDGRFVIFRAPKSLKSDI